MDKIEQYIGHQFIFRVDRILMAGYFRGIGKVDNDYGMVFDPVIFADQKLASCLIAHPRRIKCTLYSDILPLRRACRKFFRLNKLYNENSNIYFPRFEIEKVTINEERKTTKR